MLVKAEQTSVQRRRACGLPVKPGEGSAGDTEAKAEVIVSLEFTGTQEEGS